jgi:hypothetical protein
LVAGAVVVGGLVLLGEELWLGDGRGLAAALEDGVDVGVSDGTDVAVRGFDGVGAAGPGPVHPTSNSVTTTIMTTPITTALVGGLGGQWA